MGSDYTGKARFGSDRMPAQDSSTRRCGGAAPGNRPGGAICQSDAHAWLRWYGGREAVALIDRLRDHAIQDQFVYYHHRRVGDVVMWDETATMHRSAGDADPTQRRIMLRTIVRPFFASMHWPARPPARHDCHSELVQLPLTGHLQHLSNKLLELRKRAKAQPGLQIRLKLSVSSDDQRAGAFGLSNSSIAHPNLGHCPQIGDKVKIDIKARIYRAQIDFGARLYDQPPIPSCFLEIGKDDLDRTAPLWQRLGADVPAHIPHQQVGVQLAER
jgi:hypothetical protein